MKAHSLDELKNQIMGDVILPDSPTYNEQRNAFNQAGSPAVIVRAQNDSDIGAAIRFAREQGLDLSVRSGGHGFHGLATNNGGLLLDLAAFNTVEILDAKRHLVRVGSGARWGEVAQVLEPHGLALTSGDTREVGVGGLTQGGGIGWMVRTYGLAIDNLHAAEVVTADGRTLHVSANIHPDLFWAIRGGGGNFGVVTSFDFFANPHTTVVGGEVTYPIAEAETALTAWVKAMREAPEELNSTFILFSGFGPQVPAQIRVLLCYVGDNEAVAHTAIKPFLHLGSMQKLDIQKKPYIAMLENAATLPPSLKLANRSGFIKTLNKEVISTIANNYGQPGKPIVQIRGLGGAVARISPQATAFAHREYEALAIVPNFVPADTGEEQTRQIQQAAWNPLASLTHGAFINFLSDTSDTSVSTAYPDATYARLANIKAIYDPENVFKRNLNIKPALDVQA